MNREKIETLIVYLALLILTAVTVLSRTMAAGRVFAVALALGIAAFKASLIAYYFMHLKHERALIYGIALMGVVTVLILAVGIFPDIALKL